MTLTPAEFLLRAELDEATLEIWIADGWLVPVSDVDQAYGDADLARVRLIRDLTRELGVNAEGVSVILHLIDQMHGLRSALGEYVRARARERS